MAERFTQRAVEFARLGRVTVWANQGSTGYNEIVQGRRPWHHSTDGCGNSEITSSNLQVTTNVSARPFDCRVFLIGVNPASEVPFWDFWHDDTGFDRASWLDQYKLLRQVRPSKSGRGSGHAVSPIRQRIDRFVIAAQPRQILETNLYSLQPVLRNVRPDTKVIEFLLSEIKPEVLVLHGHTAKKHFRGVFGYSPTATFSKAKVAGRVVWVAGARHFSLLSLDAADLLGREVQSRLKGRN